MKAVEILAPKTIKLVDKNTPILHANEVLIEVAYCGICGTDIHIYNNQLPTVKYPITPGHEFSGTILKIGRDVTQVKFGDRVAVNPNMSCVTYGIPSNEFCYYCKKNRPHFCKRWQAIGVTKPGGFAEHVVVPETSVHLVPDQVSLLEAALMEPIACCLHGLNKLDFSKVNSVLIIGTGPIGLIMTKLVKLLSNATIIVSEPLASRRELAQKFGADYAIDPTLNLSLKDFTLKKFRHGVDIVVEAVGSSETAYEGLNLLNRGGKMLLFGVAPQEATIDLNIYNVFNNEWTIFGSFTNPNTNNQALKLLNQCLNLKNIISHIFPLEEFEAGIKMLDNKENSANKIVMKPH